jgi:hypothetical protein
MDSNRQHKNLSSKTAIISAVAAAIGTMAADSDAGWYYDCQQAARECGVEAIRARDQCYEDAKAVARDYHQQGYTEAEVRQQLEWENQYCDNSYDRDIDNCRDGSGGYHECISSG